MSYHHSSFFPGLVVISSFTSVLGTSGFSIIISFHMCLLHHPTIFHLNWIQSGVWRLNRHSSDESLTSSTWTLQELVTNSPSLQFQKSVSVTAVKRVRVLWNSLRNMSSWMAIRSESPDQQVRVFFFLSIWFSSCNDYIHSFTRNKHYFHPFLLFVCLFFIYVPLESCREQKREPMFFSHSIRVQNTGHNHTK